MRLLSQFCGLGYRELLTLHDAFMTYIALFIPQENRSLIIQKDIHLLDFLLHFLGKQKSRLVFVEVQLKHFDDSIGVGLLDERHPAQGTTLRTHTQASIAAGDDGSFASEVRVR